MLKSLRFQSSRFSLKNKLRFWWTDRVKVVLNGFMLKNDKRISLKLDSENSEQLRLLSETIQGNGGLTHTLNSLGNDALAMGIRCMAVNPSKPKSRLKRN